MAATDANDGRTLALPALTWGTVLPGARPFKFNKNVNNVFRGEVLCQSGATTAFIKDLDARQLANELLGALVAIQLGLPVPSPILARAAPDTGVGSKIQIAGSEDFLVFGSVDANASPVLQVLQDEAASAPHVMQKLADWPDLGILYAFDTWVANVDRHRGNLLLGDAGQVWAIDHSHCFTGATWQRENLDADRKYLNKLELWMTPCLSAQQKSRAAATVRSVPPKMSEGDVDRLGKASFTEKLLGDDFGAIMNFIKARAANVPNLSNAALGVLV